MRPRSPLGFAALGSVVLAGVVIFLILQNRAEQRLRDDIRSLQAQVDEFARLKAENERLNELLAQSKSETTARSNQLAELLRLRSEIGMLRQQTNELALLQAENHNLRIARAAAPGNLSLEPEMSEPVPRQQWTFMGYATPEATAQSLLWALREGDTNAFAAYLNGLVPELRAKLEQEAARRGGPAAFAELGDHETGGMAEYRIVGKIPLTENRVLVRVQAGDAMPIQTFLMKKIGDDWKMADEIK